jgi:hypothetical protein
VLALSSRDAGLFDGSGDDLRPGPRVVFPMLDTAGREEQAARERDTTTAFLRSVDRALGTYLQLHPAPLVLAGPGV